MNKVILMGRLTADPNARYGDNGNCTSTFTLAVDRRFRREGDEQTADFLRCVAFGKTGEFIEKYGRKGTKFVVEGRIQTGSYTNQDGQKVYTTDIVCENVEFAESKGSGNQTNAAASTDSDGFMNIPDGIDEELPFN